MSDHGRLAELMEARVPPDWPPEILRDALPEFARSHAAHPDWSGWLGWYAIRLDTDTPILCGSVGFKGPPDLSGRIEIGYSVLPAHRGLGIAGEMVGALVRWASAQPGVRRVEAETTEDNRPSVRVLERAGFRRVDSPDGLRFVWSPSPAA